MTYCPDVWMILKIHHHATDQTVEKVLGGWSGGWTGADNWRLSSGITRVEDTEYGWNFHNESGSLYMCHADSQRFNMMTEGIFKSLQERSAVSVEVVPFIMKNQKI